MMIFTFRERERERERESERESEREYDIKVNRWSIRKRVYLYHELIGETAF